MSAKNIAEYAQLATLFAGDDQLNRKQSQIQTNLATLKR